MADGARVGACVAITAADGGRCAITPVRAAGARPRPPVVMVPGMFSGRRFWLSDRGVGLAAYLADAGHPAYIVTRRGLSGAPPSPKRAGLEEHLRYDLPAVQAYVDSDNAQPAVWIGHSFGGVMTALAAARSLERARVAGLVLLASQYEVGKTMLAWPGNLLTRGIARVCGHFPARAAGLGPENEPIAAIDDAARWVARGQRDGALHASLASLDAPVLAISGSADSIDPSAGCQRFIGHLASPDKTFIQAGVATGFSIDYDHPGIVVSKPARLEVWPRVADWIGARAGA